MTFSSDYRPEVLTEALVSVGDHVMSHDPDPRSCDTDPKSHDPDPRSHDPDPRSCDTGPKSCDLDARSCDTAKMSCDFFPSNRGSVPCFVTTQHRNRRR